MSQLNGIMLAAGDGEKIVAAYVHTHGKEVFYVIKKVKTGWTM